MKICYNIMVEDMVKDGGACYWQRSEIKIILLLIIISLTILMFLSTFTNVKCSFFYALK